MFRHVYSYGKDSPLKIKITDRQAATYNLVSHIISENGPLIKRSSITPKQMEVYNAVGNAVSFAIKKFPRDLSAKDIHSNILIRNN